jgi:hypothetical protein
VSNKHLDEVCERFSFIFASPGGMEGLSDATHRAGHGVRRRDRRGAGAGLGARTPWASKPRTRICRSSTRTFCSAWRHSRRWRRSVRNVAGCRGCGKVLAYLEAKQEALQARQVDLSCPEARKSYRQYLVCLKQPARPRRGDAGGHHLPGGRLQQGLFAQPGGRQLGPLAGTGSRTPAAPL